MITVFADKYLFEIASYLPAEVDLHFYDPEQGLPKKSISMDALLIRTVTEINSETWQKVPENLQFIGTGSAGTDHVDIPFLKHRNISFADAGGCNARSVAEYVATSLLLWSDQFGLELPKKSVGIVGVGHVGTEVDLILKELNIDTILYDPPRAERESGFASAELNELLKTDILTFHTPLTKNGSHPTFHWLDKGKLDANNFDLIINTARGGVIDEKALLGAFEEGKVSNFILDVWENEPCFRNAIAKKAFIKTPHIAGYSKQAKLRASQLVAEALCRHFSLAEPESANRISNQNIIEFPGNIEKQQGHSGILEKVHPIKEYEKELISIMDFQQKEKGRLFNKLRAEYPLRDEFNFLKVPEEILKQYPVLKQMGISSA